MVECQKISIAEQDGPISPTSSTFSDTPTIFSRISVTSDTLTMAGPDEISEFEKIHYWEGISPDPPHLFWRSNSASNPFPFPPLGARWTEVPVKTAEGVFNTPLNPVWHTVAPLTIVLMKSRGIKHSVLMVARFSTFDEGQKILGPITIWIALHPGSTKVEQVRDASPHILQILEEHGVGDAVVEWFEGSVEKLLGPALMRPVIEINPTHHVRRPFTTTLGLPITTKEQEDSDVQGTTAFFIHEGKKKNGEVSDRVFAVSNKHVLRADTTVDYEYKGQGTPQENVRLLGDRRYQCALSDIRNLINKNIGKTVDLAEEITRLESQSQSNNSEQAEEDAAALRANQDQLAKLNDDNIKLQTFFKEVSGDWHKRLHRSIGHVHWAPKISIDVDAQFRYTLDIGTFVLDALKFGENFRGNVVDLGNRFAPHELNMMFWPNNTNPTGIKFPANRLLRIQGVVECELLANPDCFDENGDPIYIVGKDGNTTDLTVGRYSGLEAYLCDEFGKESIEVAILNYNKSLGNFSAKGDSGSLIWTGMGRMLAVLHSGMPRGLNNHVTFGTPAWWVVKQLKLRYPHADFNRLTFFPPTST